MPARNTSGYMYKSKSCARLAARGVWRCCTWRCTHFPRAVHRVCRTCRPEVSTRDSSEHKARTGITKYMPRGPVLPAWTLAMVGGARSHRGHCCSLPRHHTSPGTDTGPMTHPWDTPLCNKSRRFILSRPRGAAAAQRNGPCEMQDPAARTLSGVSQPFLGDG